MPKATRRRGRGRSKKSLMINNSIQSVPANSASTFIETESSQSSVFLERYLRDCRSSSQKCPNCAKLCIKITDYYHHLRTHLDYESYKCEICFESFSQEAGLSSHMEIHQSKVEHLSCPHCPEVFPHLFSLNRHKLMHTDGPPYLCPICKAPFSNVANRSLHVKNHAVKCALCGVYFHTNEELQEHIFVTHKKKVNKSADIEKIPVFSDMNDLLSCKGVDNIREHTDVLKTCDASSCDEGVLHEYGVDESKASHIKNDLYVCFICEQNFTSASYLKKHLGGHRFYPCTSCPKFFNKEESLEKHVATEHTDKLVNESRVNNPTLLRSDTGHSMGIHPPQASETIIPLSNFTKTIQRHHKTTYIVNKVMPLHGSEVEAGTKPYPDPVVEDTRSDWRGDLEAGNELNITWLLGYVSKCKALTLPLERKVVEKMIYLQKLISESMEHLSDKTKYGVLVVVYRDLAKILDSHFSFNLEKCI